jgi:hypothetical protein
MKYKVTIIRNSLSMTQEEAIVEASSEDEAKRKASNGDCLEIDVVECSDISELSSEIVSVSKIEN